MYDYNHNNKRRRRRILQFLYSVQSK